ncbi:MAG: N-acetylmuramoyl-L-alanine amidase [Actinobacteria bacterium]|nr:N-acetylmuramoyl-L-alanine amidase [Actinomycetota bacterium]
MVPAVALAVLGAPALALDGTPAPPPGSMSVPLAIPEGAGAGAQAVAVVPADLVGVTWKGDPTAQFRVEARRKRSGPWSPAVVVGATDVAPDDGSPDARAAAGRPNASDPVWVGGAVQVRVTVETGAVGGVGVAAVTATAGRAPAGSAGALGGTIAGDDEAFALALVLVAALLAAMALGWSPWRSRRTAAVLGVGALLAVTACTPNPPPSPNPVVAAQPAMTMQGSWGGDLPWNPDPDCGAGPEYAGDAEFLVVHHTVNSNSYGPADSRNMVRAIWRYHVQTLGYCDIAYNFVIDRFGQIFEGRRGGVDRAVVAAHAGGFNWASSGVALLGDFTSVQPSLEAWNALVDLLAWKASVHRRDPATGFSTTSAGSGGARWPAGTRVSFPNRILGHRDLGFTACPGDSFYPRLAALRAAVQPRVGWLGPAPGAAASAGPAAAPTGSTPTTVAPRSSTSSTTVTTIPAPIPAPTVSTTTATTAPPTAPTTAPTIAPPPSTTTTT